MPQGREYLKRAIEYIKRHIRIEVTNGKIVGSLWQDRRTNHPSRHGESRENDCQWLQLNQDIGCYKPEHFKFGYLVPFKLKQEFLGLLNQTCARLADDSDSDVDTFLHTAGNCKENNDRIFCK
jgi:hypothetical protein